MEPIALPKPGAACRLTKLKSPLTLENPSAIDTTIASCKARIYLKSLNLPISSMKASSVVPGLPKIYFMFSLFIMFARRFLPVEIFFILNSFFP